MSNELAAKLENIANNLCGIRLPVREASAYSTVLSAANQLFDIAEKLKEETAHDAYNQQE